MIPGEGSPLDLPELEFEQLAARLVDQAKDVRLAQSRLRSLLRANQSIIGELSLPVVLRQIVEAACELVQAPYGALGVLDPDGVGLEEFINVGIDQALADQIGHLPEGKGLLGALIEDPRTIRLRDLRDDPRSVGFPDHHPPMRGFLGVPIRVRDEVFGNLYLAALGEMEFTPEDEELVTALAATAAVAIENARLYDESRQRQRWLQASSELTHTLLTDTGGGHLQVIAELVHGLADADLVTVVVPSADRAQLEVVVAVAERSAELAGTSYPIANTISGAVLDSMKPVLIRDAQDADEMAGRVVYVADFLQVGPMLVLPLAGAGDSRGAMVVGRLRGRHHFTGSDLEMATTFANHASVALELAEGRAAQEQMLLLEERARIARDLHDHVIQQLFGAGLTIQGLMAAHGPEWTPELADIVDRLDDSIRQIRTSIFGLRPHTIFHGSLRDAVLEVGVEARRVLGFKPEIEFDGPLDLISDEALVHDVTAVVREALSNVARHAKASRVDLSIRTVASTFTVLVSDNGCGIEGNGLRSGLANLRSRAERRDGTLAVDSKPGQGTTLTWTISLA